jgi:uncharacterized protein (DUF1810 family)
MAEAFNLARFVDAQTFVYDQARAELAAGEKRSHWMWFIFPQIAGLGMSAMSRRYAISGQTEALAYLSHSILGPRLREVTALMNAAADHDPVAILGGIDAQKFRSCMTLFAAVAPEEPIFAAALAKYFGGAPDQITLTLIASSPV